MNKAILYCRVSSDEQAKGGSLKYQADALRRFCESNGIEVNASEEHLDFEVAEVDNDKRSKATKDGIHQALADGKCVGMAPYGYANKRTGKHECWIEFDPKEAPFVTEAFHRVAYGVESPTVVWRDLRSRGMKVSESTFFRILRNRFYIGQVFVPEYGDSPEQYVKGKHQALTDAKSFYLVQDRLDGNRDKAEPEVKKVPDETFFMRSFLRCPHCGQTVYGSFSKGRNKRYAYYHCNYCGKYRIAAEEAKEQPMDKEVEEKMKFSLSFIENMGSCVAAAPIHLKLNILGSIFNGKIIFENSVPRTATLSPIVSLIVGEPSVYKAHKTKQPSDSSESCSWGG